MDRKTLGAIAVGIILIMGIVVFMGVASAGIDRDILRSYQQ